jgi:hypothetical protein
LTALVSRTCPECGLRLADDLSAYRPSRRRTPWSAAESLNLLRGISWVVRRPIRTLAYCTNPAQVSWRRAAGFAVLVSALIVALWPVAREVGLLVLYLWKFRSQIDWSYVLSEEMLGVLAIPRYWRRLCTWEAFSLSRWWLLFGTLTLGWCLASGRRAGAAASGTYVRRLLLFAPWLALLELAFLAGIWVDHQNVVPEPSTIFVSAWSWTRWMWRDWLIRGAVPTFVVGVLFFRTVLGSRWFLAVLCAVLLVPVGLCGSVAWSYWFNFMYGD